MPRLTKPLTVALMNDYEIVVRGLARMLEPFAERIEIVELAIAAPSTAPVDVALYDTFAADMVFGREVKAERFVMYTVETSDHFVSAARANGADGVLSKSLSPEQLVEALERIRDGRVPRPHRQRREPVGRGLAGHGGSA